MINVKKGRGQGTTEYLIILAIVIVIALVVVGVLGGFPSLGAGVSEGTSKTYWMGTSPLAVIEYSINTGTTSKLIMRNMTASTITLTKIIWAGTTFDNTDVVLGAGATQAVTCTTCTCATTGQAYSKALILQYTTVNLTTDQNLVGIQPLVGQCQ